MRKCRCEKARYHMRPESYQSNVGAWRIVRPSQWEWSKDDLSVAKLSTKER